MKIKARINLHAAIQPEAQTGALTGVQSVVKGCSDWDTKWIKDWSTVFIISLTSADVVSGEIVSKIIKHKQHTGRKCTAATSGP